MCGKTEEVMREWRKLRNDELNNLYSSSDTIRQIKSRRITWAEHGERMRQIRNVAI
jgi:cytoplasmic iron level regulating protein YaaA (DUF328/UPF0246 family)